MTEKVFQRFSTGRPLSDHLPPRARAESGRMRDGVTSDHMASPIQFAKTSLVQKTSPADHPSRDEAAPSPAKGLEPVGDDVVVRGSAVVDGDQDTRGRPNAGRSRGANRAARRRLKRAQDSIELFERQLVAIGAWPLEPAFRRGPPIDVMEQQGDAGHLDDLVSRRASISSKP